jgi:hypothetical protein
MNWMVRLALLAALGWFAKDQVWADDGALPRGKTPAPGQKLIVPEVPAPVELADCASYIANVESGELLFTQDGKFVYFLSRQTRETGSEGKSYLYEADLENFRSKRIVSLRTGENASLVGHGQPLEAITVLDFYKARVGCGEGLSSGIGIKWIGKQKIIKSYPQGNYKIVLTDQGAVVADMDQRKIKMVDLTSFQKRTLASFGEKFFPLYVKTSPLQLTGFKPEQNELVRYEDQEAEPSAILKLKKGMRLLQDKDQFGIITSDEGGKVLQIKQIKGWSGEVFRGIDVRLPEGFLADRVGVQIDFRSGISLVQGANKALKKELKQVLVYNGLKAQVDRLLKAPEGQYFSQAVITPKARKILVLSRNLADESAHTLRLGDMTTGEWREIGIMSEPAVEKAAEKPEEKPVEKSESMEKSEKTEKKIPN